MLENAVDTIPYSRALKNKADQYKTQTGTPTSLTETMSDKIQTGYESIYVTFQHTFCMTDILTNFGSIQNTIIMLR